MFSQILRAFIFLLIKKINAKKRLGRKGWGSAVAAGYGGTSWSREKEPFLKRAFSPPQEPTHIGYRAFFVFISFTINLRRNDLWNLCGCWPVS